MSIELYMMMATLHNVNMLSVDIVVMPIIGFYRVFFYWSAPKKCQTYRKI